MEQPRSTTFIESNDIKANFNRYLAWWILFISIGYQYKLIFCGGLGLGLGQKWICYTMIHGITSNHWFEHLVYVPLMWVALHQVNQAVFEGAADYVAENAIRWGKWLNSIISLITVGFVLFMLGKAKIKAMGAAPDPGPTADQALLTEIRDALKK